MSEELEIGASVESVQQGEYSDSFKSKMNSIQGALGGLGSGNTFDVGKQDPAFRFEDVPAATPETVVATPETKVVEEAPAVVGDSAAETITPVVAEEGSVEDEINKLNSRITGEVILDAPKAEETTENVSFSNWEDFDKWTEETKLGITKDNIKDELPKLIEAKTKLDEVSKETESYKEVFTNMPKDIYDSIVLWGKGEDWRSVIKNSDPTDFELDFSSQGNKEMVERYYPGKLTAEDWEEFSDKETGDDDAKTRVKSYIEMAEGKYSVDQQSFKLQKDNITATAQRATALRQESFDKSRENIAKAFEGTSLTVTESYVAEVDKVAQNQQEVLGLFFNNDGTLKEDAHQRIAMAMDGRDLVIQQAKAMEKRAVTKAREEVIKVTPDSHSIKKSGDAGKQSEMSEAQQKVARHVEGLLGKQDDKTY